MLSREVQEPKNAGVTIASLPAAGNSNFEPTETGSSLADRIRTTKTIPAIIFTGWRGAGEFERFYCFVVVHCQQISVSSKWEEILSRIWWAAKVARMITQRLREVICQMQTAHGIMHRKINTLRLSSVIHRNGEKKRRPERVTETQKGGAGGWW